MIVYLLVAAIFTISISDLYRPSQ